MTGVVSSFLLSVDMVTSCRQPFTRQRLVSELPETAGQAPQAVFVRRACVSIFSTPLVGRNGISEKTMCSWHTTHHK
jgi:hypothetical protein